MRPRHRKRPRPKRDRAPLRKPAPEHPLDGLFRVLGLKPKRRPIHPDRPAVPRSGTTYGTSLQ